MVSVTDPAGNRVELFHGVTKDRATQSPRGVSRFVTGALGMRHIVLMIPDLEKAKDFYCRVLGFALSDYVIFGPRMGVWFLHLSLIHI